MSTGLAAILVAMGGARASAATYVDGYPFAVGDTFTYDYTSTQSVQADCTGTPSVTTQAYKEVTTMLPEVSYTISPSSVVKAYPFQTKAISTTSAGTLTVTNIDYRNFVTSGATTDYVDYGYTDTSDLVETPDITKHLSLSRTYSTPLLRDRFPRVEGDKLPLPVSYKEIYNNYYVVLNTTGVRQDTNILQSTKIRNIDGSFTNSGLDFDVPFAIVQKPDGTGTDTIGPAATPEQWIYSRPQPLAKGEVIPVVVTFTGKSGTNDVPDWLPGHGNPPSPLAASGFIDQGTQTVPAGCGAYAGKPATRLRMSYASVSPVSGYVYSETDDYYVVNDVGRVCIDVTETTRDYDSRVTGKCTQVTTLHTTQGRVAQSIH